MTSIVPFQARGVTLVFGRRSVLRGLDFRVDAGEVVGLVGANGAGKTTLFSLMAGLGPADAGTCEFGLMRLPAGHPTVRARLAYVTHNTQLYPLLTARENLELFAELRRAAAPRNTVADVVSVERVLARFGLAEHLDRRVETFSRGMAQRASLARAVASNPEIMLLDEPLTALDRHGRALLVDILREERARGAGIVLCSHDLDAVMDVADRVVLLERGVLSQQVVCADDRESFRRHVLALWSSTAAGSVGATPAMA